jgi:hypothetical protein
VSFPAPHPGLVIRYSYLWRREFETGRDEGSKDRPCAVIMALINEDGEQDVLVLPITHSPPTHPGDAIEIPAVTKQRLQLDFDRSWIVLSEANRFLWPGPDLRPVPNSADRSIAYGVLPPRFFAVVREHYLARDRQRKVAQVPRTE